MNKTKHDRLHSLFYPPIAASPTAPGRFYPVCQLPGAYHIHQFIRHYVPTRLARVVGTIWVMLMLLVVSFLSAVVNCLFTVVWFPLARLTVSRDFYCYVLESGTSLIYGSCGFLLVLSCCFFWPLFEYRGAFPPPRLSSLNEHHYLSFAANSPRSWDGQSDASSTVDSVTTSSPPPLSPQASGTDLPCCRNRSSCEMLTKASQRPNPQSPQISWKNNITTALTSCASDSTISIAAHWRPKKFIPGKTVVMVNHLSNADGLVMCGVSFGWPLKFIYKSELNKIPCLGQGLMAAREIPVCFNSTKGGWGVEKAQVLRIMDRIAALIRLSIPVLVFPEGARRRFNRMSPFRTGTFRFCVESQTEVYPTVLYGTQFCWPVGSFLIDLHEIYLVYGEHAVQPNNHTIGSLVSTVRDKMVEMLRFCPGYNNEVEKPIESFEEYEKLVIQSQRQLEFF